MKYNKGGLIPAADGVISAPIRLQPGERVITPDGTVYELQTVSGGYRWVEIGKGYAVWMGGPDA